MLEIWQNKQPQAQTSFHEKPWGTKLILLILFFFVLIERKFGQNKEKKECVTSLFFNRMH